MSIKVTQKTIAETLGVSIGTVDRALNNRGRINEDTKKKIIEMAKKLNYKPNNIARALVLNKQINIAAIFPREPYYFCDKMIFGMQDARNELSDYGVNLHLIHTESINPYTQIDVIQKIEKEKFDGIILNAGGNILKSYVDSFIENNIPIITVNSDLNDSKRLFFVGHDSQKEGKIAAELMAKFIKDNGKVVVLTGFADVYTHFQRYDGFRNIIESDYKDIKLAGPYEYKDKEELAFEVTRELLANENDIDGIYVTSAPGAIGAGRAIKESNAKRRPKLIGFDVNEYVKELLEEGICTAIIYQDPYMQAYSSVKLLIKNILDGWLPKQQHLYIRSKIILAQNVDEYMIKKERDNDFLDFVID